MGHTYRRVALATTAVLATALLTGTTTAPSRAEAAGPGSAARSVTEEPPGVTGAGGYRAPYFTTGDLTGDDQISRDDLDLLAAAVGTTSADASWAPVAPADYDADGAITATDVADQAQRVLYDDGPFELVESSALDMQRAMNAGVVTSVQLTRAYLDRIAAYDTLSDGAHARALRSVITVGGQRALDAAAASDQARTANGGPRSMLDGIPVVLKDNYDTRDLPTTGGCGCWDDNQTVDDAFMVDGLRSEGAVVLAKASLDEFAFGFVSEFSSYQPAGTSTLVASPYDLTRTAGGSSGGTGAAISANLGGIGFGTDTGGSIRVPSSYNQLVGIRPTVGLASRDGIIPLALTQDTGGPITRSVSDAAIALDGVVGVDPADPVTSEQQGQVPDSYTEYLDPTALEGTRIGYLDSMVGTNATTRRLFTEAVADLTAQGAVVEPITIDGITPILNEGSGSTNEFKHDLNAYVAAHLDPDVTARSLQGIVDSGRFVPSRRSTYTTRDAVTPAQYDAWIASHSAVIENGDDLVTSALDTNDLDALVYPSGNPYSTQGTNLRLSPNTGLPAVTVPMGQATAAEALPGAGVNLEFLGRDYAEGDLLGLTYDYEQATTHRTTPALYPALAGDVVRPDDTAPTPTDPADRAGAGAYTVTASEPAVEVGDTVEVTVAAQGADDLYAYALSVGYDPDVLEYVGGSASTDQGGVTYDDTDTDGVVDVVHTELGTSPAPAGDLDLATLRFTAVGSGQTAVSAGPLEGVGSDLTSTTTDDLGSASVGVTAAGEDAPTVVDRPRVTGSSRVGATLRATGGTWDPREVSLAYRWLRDGDPIRSATGATYQVRPGDVGSRLSVRVVASAAGRPDGSAVVAAPGPVRPAITRTRASVVRPGTVGPLARPLLRIRVQALQAPGLTPTGRVEVRYGRGIEPKAALRAGKATVTLPRRPPGTYRLRVLYRPGTGFKVSREVVVVRVHR